MNKERMIGFIMLALLIIITVVYFVFTGQVKNLEAENERLKEAIVENENENFSTTETKLNESEAEDHEDETSKDETTTTEENSEVTKESTSISQMNDYDKFLTEFVEHVFTNKDVEDQRVQLEEMTSENAYQYLREKYYVLDAVEEAELNNPTEDTAMEGEYESLELDSKLNDVQTYYTFNGDLIETLTVFKLVTDAEGETFSGNFVLKGELSRGENGIQMQNIQTITSLNEPNAEQLFN